MHFNLLKFEILFLKQIDLNNPLSLSWAGGEDGREVIDRVFPLVSNVLSPNGVFYMVIIQENKPGLLLN